MQSKEKDHLIFIRLFPKEDVFEKIQEACEKHHVISAVVLSGIGQLHQFSLGYFKKKGEYVPMDFNEPYELVSLSGLINKQNSSYEFHLHASFGDEQKNTVSGHFIKGEVSVTAEIVLQKTLIELRRKVEDETGLKGLFLE
jgi:predicted DNA-binding protein with PD1-like motif